MPTMVTDDPLRVACVFSDGSRAEFELAGLPNPRLARDLAAGLVDLIHPHGNADSVGTVVGWLGLRQPGHSRLIRGIDRVVVQRWVLRHGLVASTVRR